MIHKSKKDEPGFLEYSLVILLVLAVVALSVASCGFITMLVWSAVVPSVFGGPVLDFGQALGLYFLLAVLGGAFRVSYSSGSKKDE